MKNKHIGSDFDKFLKKEGMLEETTTAATKRVIAYQKNKDTLNDKQSGRKEIL